jgi:hypothetical protein
MLFNESWASLPKRNRRWRKSHHNKNLTAPRSSERETCENISSADRRLTDRQLITGIQIRRLGRVHALAAILQRASALCRNNGLRCFQLAESSAFRFLHHEEAQKGTRGTRGTDTFQSSLLCLLCLFVAFFVASLHGVKVAAGLSF